MKKFELAFALIITLALILAVISESDRRDKVNSHSEVIHSLEGQIERLSLKIDNNTNAIKGLDINRTLLDRINELTRDNERLVMENASLKYELKETGWWRE